MFLWDFFVCARVVVCVGFFVCVCAGFFVCVCARVVAFVQGYFVCFCGRVVVCVCAGLVADICDCGDFFLCRIVCLCFCTSGCL